jgi:hypothetical protein
MGGQGPFLVCLYDSFLFLLLFVLLIGTDWDYTLANRCDSILFLLPKKREPGNVSRM